MERRIAVLLAVGALLCIVVFVAMSWIFPPLMESTVIQESNLTIPQYCSDPNSACQVTPWNSEEFVLKEGETATLQAKVVILSSITRRPSDRGVDFSLYGTSEIADQPGCIIGPDFDYSFMGATPRPSQSNSFYVKYTGHYRLAVMNGEVSEVMVSFALKVTPSWSPLIPAVTAGVLLLLECSLILIYVVKRRGADTAARSHVFTRISPIGVATIFCIQCGAENPSTYEYCGKCGNKLVAKPICSSHPA